MRMPTDIEVFQELGQRSVQQDGFIVSRITSGLLLAVFDGHGRGAQHLVADLTRQLPNAFARQYDRVQPRDEVRRERQVLRATVRHLVRRHETSVSGSTATVAWVRPLGKQVRIHIALLGDSPAALWDGQRLHVPRLHSAGYHIDSKGIQRFIDLRGDTVRYHDAAVDGGYVWLRRYWGPGVAVTRAIGDGEFGDLLLRRPELYTYTVANDTSVLLLASDGALVGVSPVRVRMELRRIVDDLRNGLTARQVAALLTDANDNRTLLVARFQEG